MFWVRHLEEAVTRLSTVHSSVEHTYDKRLLAVERKLDTLTETFVNLVKRLNTIIDLQKGQRRGDAKT
jgi:hypothetical protein